MKLSLTLYFLLSLLVCTSATQEDLGAVPEDLHVLPEDLDFDILPEDLDFASEEIHEETMRELQGVYIPPSGCVGQDSLIQYSRFMFGRAKLLRDHIQPASLSKAPYVIRRLIDTIRILLALYKPKWTSLLQKSKASQLKLQIALQSIGDEYEFLQTVNVLLTRSIFFVEFFFLPLLDDLEQSDMVKLLQYFHNYLKRIWDTAVPTIKLYAKWGYYLFDFQAKVYGPRGCGTRRLARGVTTRNLAWNPAKAREAAVPEIRVNSFTQKVFNSFPPGRIPYLYDLDFINYIEQIGVSADLTLKQLSDDDARALCCANLTDSFDLNDIFRGTAGALICNVLGTRTQGVESTLVDPIIDWRNFLRDFYVDYVELFKTVRQHNFLLRFPTVLALRWQQNTKQYVVQIVRRKNVGLGNAAIGWFNYQDTVAANIQAYGLSIAYRDQTLGNPESLSSAGQILVGQCEAALTALDDDFDINCTDVFGGDNLPIGAVCCSNDQCAGGNCLAGRCSDGSGGKLQRMRETLLFCHLSSCLHTLSVSQDKAVKMTQIAFRLYRVRSVFPKAYADQRTAQTVQVMIGAPMHTALHSTTEMLTARGAVTVNPGTFPSCCRENESQSGRSHSLSFPYQQRARELSNALLRGH